MNLAGQKQEIRRRVRAQRTARDAAAQSAAAAALAAHMQRVCAAHAARRITCYMPYKAEPDTQEFMRAAWAAGLEILLPVALPGGQLAWVSHAGPAAPALRVGMHGIPTPAGPHLPTLAAATADLMFVPACAVDEQGIRLGWGGGYYDRLFELLTEAGNIPPVYAVLFTDEVFPALPREEHDIPVSAVVTPSGIKTFTPTLPEYPAC